MRRRFTGRAFFFSPFGAMLVAALVALPFLASRGIYEPTEGRYAQCAREMLDSGQWLVPTLEGEPHWTKPPLAYWAIAIGMKILGANDAGARLANAIAFILTVGAICLLGRTLASRRAGGLAALIYATAPFPALMAWGASTDVLLTMFETFAVLAAARAVAERDSVRARSARWIVACYLSLGLAFLTKGPIALIAVVPIAYLFARSARRPGQPLGIGNPIAILLGVVVGVSWYVVVAIHDPSVIDYWIHHEILDRTLTDSAGRNALWFKPFVIYLPPLLFGAGLWLIPLWAGGSESSGTVGTSRLARFRARLSRWTLGPAYSNDRLFAYWVLIPLGALSLSRSRLPLYVLPLFPAIALLLATRATGATGATIATGATRRREVDGRTTRSRGPSVLKWLGASVALLFATKLVWSRIDTDHDMTRLAGAIESVAKDASVFVYHEDELYGLSFELGRGLKRVADVEDLANPIGRDGSLDDAAKELLRLDAKRCVLISRERRHSKVEAALDCSGPMKWRVVHSAGWNVYAAALE